MKRPISHLPSEVSSSGENLLQQQRKELPVYKVKNRLLKEIGKYDKLIIIGETGSGKTTQIPQFIVEKNIEGDGKVAVTQPRRVAAISLSQRVALEMSSYCTHNVGYCVRFEDTTDSQTKIVFITDGMLLREAMLDECLRKYSIIMLDEAHERTVHTDVLFGIVKRAQSLRASKHMTPLKIVVMSATMDVDQFSQYFDTCPVLYLEGRQYPVQLFHSCEPQQDYIHSTLVTVFQIHREAPANHDILVFLTGQEEIEAVVNSIRTIVKDPSCEGPPLKVYPLYAALPASKQLEVFKPAPVNTRKVIVSTNIAETSVTIEGIKYVVDSGKVKVRIHEPRTGLDMLKVCQISQAQAWQRAGRAGRQSQGFCYRVYTQQEFDRMTRNTVPEILRCNLSSVCLQLLALGIDARAFDFMDKPPAELLDKAFQELKILGAIEDVLEPTLTLVGKNMAAFPLDPKMTKIILSASQYGCLEEALTVIALLSGESIFISSNAKKEEAAIAKAKFVSSAGDHVTLLQIFRAYNNAPTKHAWCYTNFFNARNLEYASRVRKQLVELCRRCDVQFGSCGQDTDQLRKCLIAGLFMNLAQLTRDKKYVTVSTNQAVNIHPTSVLHGSYPPLVLYTELVHTTNTYMRFVTPVHSEWVHQVAPKSFHPHLPSE